MQAGTAVVATSIVSTAMNLLIVYCQVKDSRLLRDLTIATLLQAVAGIAALTVELRWLRFYAAK